MAKVLTMESETLCGTVAATHGGKIAKLSTEKLTVNSKSVLVADSVVGKSIATCAQTPVQAKCTTVSTVTAVFSTKLTVGGKPVLIGLAGTTDKTGTLAATAVQTKLDAL
jgi:hypothetical protein